MRYYIVFIIILASLFISCIFNYDDENYIVRQVYSVDSLHVIKSSELEISLKTFSTVPNPCYEFSHFEISKNKNEIEITIFAKARKDIVCIQILGQLESEITFKVDAPGKYKLRFPGRSSDFDTVIVIND